MSYPEFLARPIALGGTASLQAHLEETRQLAAELSPEDSQLQQVACVAAALHDFGKLTEWFQSYIQAVDAGDSPDLSREQRRQKQHARISAYAVEYTLYKCDIEEPWRTYAFLAVAKHHQSLPNTEDSIQRSTNLKRQKNQQRFELVQEQLENIYQTANSEADTLLREASGGEGSLDDFVNYVLNRRTHDTLSDFDVEQTTYEELLHLWGILIAADKLAAAGLNIHSEPPHSPELIDAHIASFPAAETEAEQRLNSRREQARQGVTRRLDDFQRAETNLATITLPTGFGKTLTGVQVATTLADETNRVIYSFPYTSILDQTDEVLQDALNVAPASPDYTVHHHLAETRTLPEGTQVDTDAAELLAETWQAPLVLTTFVQLFESLAGPTNSQGVKLPSLENAVVLLDEPQALPERWWRFIAWTIDLLTREFNATVVLMTATQPRLLEYLPHTDDPFELVPNYHQYFDFLSESPRVQYRLDDSVQSYLAAPRSASPRPVNDAVTEVLTAEETQVLSVGNTVASVAEFGEQLDQRLSNALSLNRQLAAAYQEINSAEAFQSRLVDWLVATATENQGPVVATLTARLRPLDRRIILAVIRRLLESDTPLYVASTQLIEAGVDISFGRVYRDLAPLPSLIQTAGRCNREFGGDVADVVVWRLRSPEHGIATSDIIYRDGYDLLGPTRETLQSHMEGGIIAERQMAVDASEEYFRRLHTDVKPGDRELVTDGERARFAALGEESLIPEQYPQVELYIAVTENERRLFEAYCEFAEMGQYRRLRNLRRVMQQRQVSVPANTTVVESSAARPFPDSEHTYYLDGRELSEYPLDRGGAR